MKIRSLPTILFPLILLLACGTGDTVSQDPAPPGQDTEAPAEDVRMEPGLDTGPEETAEDPPILSSLATQLDPSTVPAGEKALVTCLGIDQYGDPIDAGPVTIVVPQGIDKDGSSVSGLKAGAYEINCTSSPDPNMPTEPATLTIIAGKPTSMTLALKPSKDYYKPGSKVTVHGVGEDEWGNPMPEIPVTSVNVFPASMGTADGDQVTFAKEGEVAIKAYAAANTGVEAETTVVVDSEPPIITVEYPERAAALSGNMNIQVSGSIDDSCGITQASFNGAPLVVAGSGDFVVAYTPHQGMNVLTIEAEDCAGRTARHLQAFLFSEHYHPVPDGPMSGMLVPGGILAWMDGSAFTCLGLGPEICFSDLAETVVAGLDLAGLIPNPAANQGIAWCSYDIHLNNLSIGTPAVEMSPMGGGLDIKVSLPDLSADLWAPAPELGCPDMEGLVTAEAVSFEMFAAVDIQDGELAVELTSVEVELEGLEIDLYGIVGELAQALLFFFQDGMTDMMETEFEDQIKEQFEAQLEGLLGQVNLDLPLTIPPFLPGAPGANTEVHVRPAGIETSNQGLTYSMSAAFTAEDTKELELPGSITRSSCLGDSPDLLEVDGKHYMEVALHMDVLNQSAYGVWLDGGADMETDGAAFGGEGLGDLGVEDLEVVTFAHLPPIFSDCYEDGVLRVSLSEMQLDITATVMGLPLELGLRLFFTSKVAAKIVGSPGAQSVQLSFGDVEWMDTQLMGVNEVWQGSEGLITDMLGDTLSVEFTKTLQDNPYTIPVSGLPLGDMLPVLPPGWTLVPVIDEISIRQGHLLVKVHLEAGTD